MRQAFGFQLRENEPIDRVFRPRRFVRFRRDRPNRTPSSSASRTPSIARSSSAGKKRRIWERWPAGSPGSHGPMGVLAPGVFPMKATRPLWRPRVQKSNLEPIPEPCSGVGRRFCHICCAVLNQRIALGFASFARLASAANLPAFGLETILG